MNARVSFVMIGMSFCLAFTESDAQERQIGGVGVTVFADRNFRGRSATLRNDTPNLQAIGLNDRVSSLQIGPGEQWEVCEHANYEGRCVVVSGSESDLRRSGWNEMISSARRLRGGPERPQPTPEADWYIVLFDQRNFRGNPRNYSEAVARLSGRVESVTIGRGAWELCEQALFQGRCVTLDTSASDLGRYGMQNRVGSVRPVSRQPR